MKLDFLPQPKNVTTFAGAFRIPRGGTVGVSSWTLYPAAQRLQKLFGLAAANVSLPGITDTIALRLGEQVKPGGYRLAIDPLGIALDAADVAGAMNGLATLEQIVRQTGAVRLPCLAIEDWPDFTDRGVYYDVCRGRVPKLDRLLELADRLAAHKINQLQLYIEHTFKFRRHPLIGKDADPLTAEDIMALDARCRDLGIELVPSLASFGHMMNVLTIPQYHHLAEDLGVGEFKDTDGVTKNPGIRRLKGWTLSPAVPEIYTFLDELFAEFLPCFSSPRFNVCCDETWDLGFGQSYDMVQKTGKGRVYLGHIVRLNELARKHGKRTQFWGDIIHHHPELIPEVPKDVTVLEWGYDAAMDFDRVRKFTETGLSTYVCPSVCGYVTWFPRLPESRGNIAGMAKAGLAHGATGLLNTDWGDGGHQNFMEVTWPGYLFGAEQSWNAAADQASFTRRFCKLFLDIDDARFTAALDRLGDIAQIHTRDLYQSILLHVFYAKPGDRALTSLQVETSTSTGNVITVKPMDIDAALGRKLAGDLAKIRAVFAARAGRKGADRPGVLPYWLFAVDAMMHAARKLTVLGPGGIDTPTARRALARELKSLRKRFEKLWLARNRRSEIKITLDKFDAALKALA